MRDINDDLYQPESALDAAVRPGAGWSPAARPETAGLPRSFTDGTSLANQSALGQEIGAGDLRA